VLRLLLPFLSFCFRCLPRRLSLAIGAALGWLWYAVVPVRRKVVRANLALAFPSLPVEARERIARDTFIQLARSAVEFLRLPGLTPRRAAVLVERVGEQHLEAALAQGRGVIAVTAHFGNFDLAACAEALRGLPLHVVTREQHTRAVNSYWMRVRRRLGVGLLPAKGSILRIHRLLREGKVVALVIDQHMPVGRGIIVPFFGKPASTTHAPATLALATGAPLLPVTVLRLAGGRHRLVFEAPIAVDHNAKREPEILRITQVLNLWLEEKIRAHPEHWLWLHRRWKV
jgi:Kdo2-lipid IVA lauroyltransferase/acyltransferase